MLNTRTLCFDEFIDNIPLPRENVMNMFYIVTLFYGNVVVAYYWSAVET